MANFDHLFKILLLGERSTGTEELCKKYFINFSSKDSQIAIGVEFYIKLIDFQGKKIEFQIWDFKPEERFTFLLNSYCVGASGSIIMYDITNPKTLKRIPEWVQIIRKKAGDIPIILAGNKFELESHREVSEQEGIEIARKHNLYAHWEISTKTGHNIEELFEEFIEILIKNLKSPKEMMKFEKKEKGIKEVPSDFYEGIFPKNRPIQFKVNSDMKEVKLRIEELDKSRSGRSLCYIDPNILEQLGLTTGNIIEMRGRKKTAGIAVSSITDKGKRIIRLDGLQRLNVGANIGEYVTIRLARVYPAREVELTPTTTNIDLKRQADAVKAKLIDKPFVVGDIVDVLGAVYHKSDPGNPMNEIMSMFMKSQKKRPKLGILRFIVENTKPFNKIVKVVRDTLIKVNKRVARLNILGGTISYSDIGGMDEVIQEIKEIIELPLSHPEIFHKLNIDPPKGILLYGIPGVGKTLLIKAISQEINAHFISISGPEIFTIAGVGEGKFPESFSRIEGAGESKLREIFREAEENSPSIIFIDKIDSIAPKEYLPTDNLVKRVIAQLLTLMDGIKSRGEVIVIAETHRIDDINDAIRRPGRFDREIEIKPPDIEGRYDILKIHTRQIPLHENVDLHEIAEKTEGLVGADLKALVREAALLATKEILPEIEYDKPIPPDVLNRLQITMAHFLTALEIIKPSSLD